MTAETNGPDDGMGTQERYRRVRTSYLSHEVTRGLNSLQTHILLAQCLLANWHGLLTRSVKLIAEKASGGSIRHTAEDVIVAIRAMQDAGIVRWWPELEILWWINVADDQEPHRKRNKPKIWKSLYYTVCELPIEVGSQIAYRYQDELREHIGADCVDRFLEGPRVDDGQVSLFGDATPTAPPEKKPKTVSSKPPERITEAFVNEVIDAMNASLRELSSRKGIRKRETAAKRIRKVTKREDATLEDWKTVIRRSLTLAKQRRSQVQWHTLVSITRPDKWEELLDMAEPSASAPGGRQRQTSVTRSAPGDFADPANQGGSVRRTS